MSRLASYKGLGAPQLRVENVSLASTRVQLTDAQQGALLVLDGTTGSTVEIALPQPETGMEFHLLFTTGGVTAVTKILSTGFNSDILVAGSTAKGVANATTAEGGVYIRLVAVSDNRWMAFRQSGSTLALVTATS